jgi:ABC-2 type transport system ATP-binding protein
MPEYAIETVDLTKRFGNHIAVDGLDLQVEHGSVHSLLGPNGAGKTTILNMLSGVIKPTRGTARILGYDVVKEAVKAKGLIGYLPEQPAIYEILTVREFLNLVGRAYAVPKETLEKTIDEYLEWFDLKRFERTFCGALSHGLKQRVVVCSVLIHDPKVVLLDEPFYGLDPASSRLFKEFLKARVEKGGTILVSTHVLEVVERFCDKVTIINQGRIIAAGSLDQLKAQAGVEKDKTLEDAFLALTRR